MNAGEKIPKDQMYNFTSEGFYQQKKAQTTGVSQQYDIPDLDEVAKARLEQNNKLIKQFIASQNGSLQPNRNFSLPFLSGLLNANLVNKDKSNPLKLSPRRENPASTRIKNIDSRTQLTTPVSSPHSPDKELLNMNKPPDIGNLLSQVSPKYSLSGTPTQIRLKFDKSPNNLGFPENNATLKAKFQKEKSHTQPKVYMKRDTSYIADALLNPSLTARLREEDNSPPLSLREGTIMQSSIGMRPQTQRGNTSPKILKQKSVASIILSQQQYPSSNGTRKEIPEADSMSLDPLIPILKSEERKTVENSKSDFENSNNRSPTRFTEHLSKNVSTEIMDKVSPSSYIVKKTFRRPATLGVNDFENLLIPRLATLSPTKTIRKTKQETNDPSEENNLFAELKKECPSSFSSLPAGRQDVLMLSSWVEGKINQVVGSDLDEEIKCSKCDEIYNLCLNELLRQISLECAERGELLYKVWTSYYQVLLQFKSNLAAESQKEKVSNLRDLKEQSELFQVLLSEKELEIENIKKDYLKVQQEKNSLHQLYQEAVYKEGKYKNKIDQLRDVITCLKVHVEDLKLENTVLADQQLKDPQKEGRKMNYLGSKAGGIKFNTQKTRHIQARSNLQSPDLKNENLQKAVTLSISGSPEGNAKVPNYSKSLKPVENRKDNYIDSDESTESEDEFEFLDVEANIKRKFTIDFLNTNVLPHRPNGTKREIDIQTSITLVSDKYDDMFESQDIIDDLAMESRLKKRLVVEKEDSETKTEVQIQTKEDENKDKEAESNNKTPIGFRKLKKVNFANIFIHHETQQSETKNESTDYKSHTTVQDIPPISGSAQEDKKAKPEKDRDSLSDKARSILLMRMYRIEREKVKDFKFRIQTLETDLSNEKENLSKVNNELKEVKFQLEIEKTKCIHSSCPICENRDNLGEDNENKPRKTVENKSRDVSLDIKSDFSGISEEESIEAGKEFNRQKSERRKRPKVLKQATLLILPDPKKKKQKEQKVNPALSIIASIKEGGMKKFKNFMPLKSILKHIYTLYNDRSKDFTTYKDEEFPNFVYTWFLNNFAFRKLAEQKFIIFVLSVKKYLYVVRINLFARFMGLLDGSANYTLDEFNKYLEAIEYINKLNLGSPIQNNETDTKHYIPFLKGIDYIKYFAETKMNFEEYVEFRKGIEAIKEIDPKGINRNGIVDFDLIMTKVLSKYRILCHRTKQHVVSAFKAADLDGNKYCSLKEFIILYRNIEPEKFDSEFAETAFNEHADVKVEGQIHLSFDKFTVVCVEYGLFSDAQQDQFLRIQTEQDIINKMQNLKEKWDQHYHDIQVLFKTMSTAPKSEVAYWQSILDVLATRVSSTEDLTSQDVKPLLIAFKILLAEVQNLEERDLGMDSYGVIRQKSGLEGTGSKVLKSMPKI